MDTQEGEDEIEDGKKTLKADGWFQLRQKVRDDKLDPMEVVIQKKVATNEQRRRRKQKAAPSKTWWTIIYLNRPRKKIPEGKVHGHPEEKQLLDSILLKKFRSMPLLRSGESTSKNSPRAAGDAVPSKQVPSLIRCSFPRAMDLARDPVSGERWPQITVNPVTGAPRHPEKNREAFSLRTN